MLKAYGKCTYLYLSGQMRTQVDTGGFVSLGGGIFASTTRSFSQYEIFISQLWETDKLYMIIFTCIETIKSMKQFWLTLLLAIITVAPDLYSQESLADKGRAWRHIEPCFTPPARFRDSVGDYRSALRFYNGDMVANPTEWKSRRNEILAKWNAMLGEWPPLIENNYLQIISKVLREDFIQYTVRFRWTPNEFTTGYLLVPVGEGKKPAVITVFYEPETAIGLSDKPNRDFAYQLVKRGFITLSIGTKEASEAKTYALFYPELNHATIQPLSMLAYAAANAWNALSRFPDVDSTRIGIVGHSFGGKWAMFASCLFDKFACAAWSDPGIVFDETRESVNYWEPYYLGYHPQPWRPRGVISKDNPAKGLYPELRKKGFDLHELHALMAPRPFLVSGGSEDPVDRWIPLNRTIEVYKLLGYENRVGMSNRPDHSPTTASNEIIYSFFEYYLK